MGENSEGKVAVVTAGGSGMGAGAARKLAEDGFNVAILSSSGKGEALAEELASEGIWVNAVVPSIIDTPANRAGMPDADHSAWPSTDALAETIAFLASPANKATRGGLVPVYGRS